MSFKPPVCSLLLSTQVNPQTQKVFYREHWRHVQYDTDEQVSADDPNHLNPLQGPLAAKMDQEGYPPCRVTKGAGFAFPSGVPLVLSRPPNPSLTCCLQSNLFPLDAAHLFPWSLNFHPNLKPALECPAWLINFLLSADCGRFLQECRLPAVPSRGRATLFKGRLPAGQVLLHREVQLPGVRLPAVYTDA